MSKKFGLGKGLGALIPDEVKIETIEAKEIEKVIKQKKEH